MVMVVSLCWVVEWRLTLTSAFLKPFQNSNFHGIWRKIWSFAQNAVLQLVAERHSRQMKKYFHLRFTQNEKWHFGGENKPLPVSHAKRACALLIYEKVTIRKVARQIIRVVQSS